MNQRIRVSNDNSFFVTLMLEPWGEDYGMNPKDEFEIVAESVEETFYFHVSCDGKYINVFAEGDRYSYPRIFQNGTELTCGHNRQD
jgi:hypothetical protein